MTDTTTLAVPNHEEITATWPRYYSIALSDVGETGAVVVLGHHDDPRRVVAALNRHARLVWGTCSLLDGVMCPEFDDAAAGLTRHWAAFATECEDAGRPYHRPGCVTCTDIRAGHWWLSWDKAATDPGAFPVTHWEEP